MQQTEWWAKTDVVPALKDVIMKWGRQSLLKEANKSSVRTTIRAVKEWVFKLVTEGIWPHWWRVERLRSVEMPRQEVAAAWTKQAAGEMQSWEKTWDSGVDHNGMERGKCRSFWLMVESSAKYGNIERAPEYRSWVQHSILTYLDFYFPAFPSRNLPESPSLTKDRGNLHGYVYKFLFKM